MAESNYPVWPGWETVRLIGRGSFGAVYEIQQRDAFDGGIVDRAALKHLSIPQSDSEIAVLRSEGLDSTGITEAFRDQARELANEYKLMRRLNDCSNVVKCDEVRYIQHTDDFGWDVLIKMELLTSLLDRLDSSPFPEEETIKLGKDLCRALIHCQKYRIVHRDIKPQNIMVSDEGNYKLGDFGIARTKEGSSTATARIGTYDYMAPEVYYGEHYGASADLYSLGVVLYWLLNRQRCPFQPLDKARMSSDDRTEARQRRFRGEPIPAPADGSPALQRIVLKACAYDPKDRYRDADEMLRDLEALDAAASDETVMDPLPPRAEPGGTIQTYFKAAPDGPVYGSGQGRNLPPPEGRNYPPPEPPGPPMPRLLLPALIAVLALALVIGGVLYTRNHKERSVTNARAGAEASGQQEDAAPAAPATPEAAAEEEPAPAPEVWSEPSYEWSEDHSAVTATRVCENDGRLETETAYSTSRVTTAATCTAAGTTTYTVSFQNSAFQPQTKTASIPATGHSWGSVSYNWSGTGSCTATRVCAHNSAHRETETAYSTSRVTAAATCTAAGTTTYTVSFQNSAFQTQTKTASIPATGHSWGSVSYNWSGTGSCTATRVCAHNSAHRETETAYSTSRVTTAATCTAAGTASYTVSFQNSAFQTQTKTASIPALGHSWGSVSYTWSGDSGTCTATRVCAHNSAHRETETAYSTSRATTATVSSPSSSVTYTASFANGTFKTQTKTVTRRPGSHDLAGQTGITLPSGSWLSDYQVKVVRGTKSGNAYLRWDPSRDGREYKRYVSEGAWVLVLAAENGFSLVKTDDGSVGWVTSSLLSSY